MLSFNKTLFGPKSFVKFLPCHHFFRMVYIFQLPLYSQSREKQMLHFEERISLFLHSIYPMWFSITLPSEGTYLGLIRLGIYVNLVGKKYIIF